MGLGAGPFLKHCWFHSIPKNHLMSSKFAILFPGQGSQSIGMLSALAERYPLVGQTFEEASERLGFDLGRLIAEGPAEQLNQTENTQPAMLAAGIAVWRVWLEQGGAQPASMAGHSLGEYTALIAAGALDFGDAIELVRQRGRFMQEAVPEGSGAMAAILGLDDETVRGVCAEAAGDEVVEAVNLNAPGQVVIAGDRAAVERAMQLAKDAGAKRALPLPVSVPSHCALMRPAADRLAEVLGDIPLHAPRIPVLHNVDVETSDDPEQIARRLVAQLHSPVRWVETIEGMREQGITTLIESGPGKVLTGLCKRIDKTLTGLPVFDPASLDKALEATHA